jgi:hypothetical protein
MEVGCLMELAQANYLKSGGANWQLASASTSWTASTSVPAPRLHAPRRVVRLGEASGNRDLASLTEDDLHFLTLVSDLAQDWDRVAAHTATLADSCRRRHARICERMARWLNDDIEEDAA